MAIEAYRKHGDAKELARALGIFMQPAMLDWALDELAQHPDTAHAPYLTQLATRPGLPVDLASRARRMVADLQR